MIETMPIHELEELVSREKLNMLVAEIRRLNAEIDWLQFFYSEADFGPADEDVREMIREKYELNHRGGLPRHDL